jgi:hypothetical protein
MTDNFQQRHYGSRIAAHDPHQDEQASRQNGTTPNVSRRIQLAPGPIPKSAPAITSRDHDSPWLTSRPKIGKMQGERKVEKKRAACEAARKLTGRRQTEWTGTTHDPE